MSVDALKVGKVNYDYNVKKIITMSLQDKYSKGSFGCSRLEFNDLKVFKNKTAFFTFQELLLQALQK